MRIASFISAVALALFGCGPKECALDDPNSCPTELACETVSGRSKPLCFPPVTLKGKVFDLSSTSGIEGAQVLATDENGAPAGTAATSDKEGAYTLRIPSARTDDQGTFTSRRVRLQSQARNYVPFPSGARISLPIDSGAATRKSEGEPWVLTSGLTDVGLTPVETSARDLPTVSGKVKVSAGQAAVLVALEGGPGAARTTLASADGSFSFFNVGGGGVKVSAWTKGQNFTPVDVSVGTADVPGVVIEPAGAATATLSGSVQLVAGASNAGTSVVLVLESTFLASLGRGVVIPGLRAPESGAPTVTGSWSISGIPDGKYVVLAAFENDGNVRDPDPGISGTQVQHLTVNGGAIGGSPSFKVTGAVELQSPGRDAIDATSATPTLTWGAYSNADAWEVQVFDQLGNQVWSLPIGNKATTSVVYAGSPLTAGQYYQWRVTAMRRGAPTSHSEELRGLFRVQPN